MDTQINPNFSHQKLENASIEDFIDVLEDRIVHWLLKPTKVLLETPHGRIAAVALLLSYFEAHMIYLKGEDSNGQSKRFFREGFVDVFANPKFSRTFFERVADFLYQHARCVSFMTGFSARRFSFEMIYLENSL